MWQEDLDPSIPDEKVLKDEKILIYGVRSNGSQAETGLRKTANIFKNEHPEICEIMHRDIHNYSFFSDRNIRTQIIRWGANSG